jgi:glycerol-3-phosphate dehydrogenase (NAD(P)+)
VGLKKISFLGAGSIGTALANVIAETRKTEVLLHTIEEDVIASINSAHVNTQYFPSVRLDDSLKATGNNTMLSGSKAIFLAVPSIVLLDYLESIRDFIPPETVLVNLAKGFGRDQKTIVRCLNEMFPNPVMTMKGPTFAREIINRVPSGFTLGSDKEQDTGPVSSLFDGTSVYLDFSDDPEGVEILSILKNIYAIALGIVDAQFNSPNIRFLVLTKTFREMHKLLLESGGKEETIFKYCGFGDFTLTALNDLSRNRTLGLLIGKGFFTPGVSHELVLEGQVAVNIFYEKISADKKAGDHFPILSELFRVMNHNDNLSTFIKAVLDA